MLIYGAHLLRNGAARILERMMAAGWLTHLATNGAGTIHDWEYAWLGASTESVEQNVATGTFGSWHETADEYPPRAPGRCARRPGLWPGAGAVHPGGRGDAAAIPTRSPPRSRPSPGIRSRAPAPSCCGRWRASGGPSGRIAVEHRWKHASILAQAFRHGVPMTVHPGIGYDIISNHPVFNGAAIGRAAEWDFKLFGGSLAGLDGGVVLSIGSAIMGPQVFEKALSCVNNLRLQDGLDIVRGHTFYVVDLQDGGGWDWTHGEPPKTNPGLLPPLLQELFPDGRRPELRAVRQRDVPPPSLPTTGQPMNAERFLAITGRYPKLRIAVVGRLLPRPLPAHRPGQGRDVDRDGPDGLQRRGGPRPAGRGRDDRQ